MNTTSRNTHTIAPRALVTESFAPLTLGIKPFLWSISAFTSATALLNSTTHRPAISFILCLSLVMTLLRLIPFMHALMARARLSGSAMRLVTLAELKPELTQARRTDSVFFGYGFTWTPAVSQLSYEITKIDYRELLLPSFLTRLLTGHEPKPEDTIGLSYIDGLSSWSAPLFVKEKTLEGGTLLVGTTQSGKGVLMTLLVTQSILRGDTVIVFDPKSSPRLRDAIEEAARAAKRKAPYIFHPGSDSSVRMNPLRHFNRESEIATRITAVMNEDGPFTAFAWNAVFVIVSLLVALKREPTLTLIAYYLEKGPGELVIDAIRARLGDATTDALIEEAAERHIFDETKVRAFLIEAYSRKRETLSETPLIRAIDMGIEVLNHNSEHYQKITASLVPVLRMLTSGRLAQSLSPSGSGRDDTPTITLESVIDEHAILYVATDALPDPTVASAIGAILIADLASLAGERYNQRKTSGRIALFIDECSNVINDPLIEILNKGAESGIRTTCAMQTVSDLAARLGSEAKARQALGNFNNLICLRTKDGATADYVSEMFGKTYISKVEGATGSAANGESPECFTASFTKRVSSSREELVPEHLLGRLPNTEWFACIAGADIVKGRTPILIKENRT